MISSRNFPLPPPSIHFSGTPAGMEEVRKRSVHDGEKEVKVMPSCPS